MKNELQKNLIFDNFFRTFKSLPAVVTENGVLTYEVMYRLVREAALRLEKYAVRPGELIAIMSTDLQVYPLLLLTVWYQRMVAVPVNTRWPVPEIEKKLRGIGCRKIIISAKDKDSRLINGLEILSPADLISWNREDVFEDSISSGVDSDASHLMPPADIDPQRGIEESAVSDHPATIIFTSGSSDRPKAAVHSFKNHVFSALGSNQNIPVQPGDRWLLSLPIYHVGGLAILFRTFLSGGAVVTAPPGVSMAEMVRKFSVTHLSMVPTQLQRFLQESDDAHFSGKIKAILLGGSAIPPNLIREAVQKGLPVFSSYGSTEMSSQISTTLPGDSLPHLFTAGKSLPYRELKIADDEEILVRGLTLFKGYRSGETLNPADTEDGWFRTGDLGRIRPDGYLIVTGRKDHMFISGGENIQPEEIEEYLKKIGTISEAVVVAVANETYGMRPVAFVRMKDGKTPGETRLRQKLEKELPRYKIPDRIFPWPEFANEVNFKINRKAFQDFARQLIENQFPPIG